MWPHWHSTPLHSTSWLCWGPAGALQPSSLPAFQPASGLQSSRPRSLQSPHSQSQTAGRHMWRRRWWRRWRTLQISPLDKELRQIPWPPPVSLPLHPFSLSCSLPGSREGGREGGRGSLLACAALLLCYFLSTIKSYERKICFNPGGRREEGGQSECEPAVLCLHSTLQLILPRNNTPDISQPTQPA